MKNLPKTDDEWKKKLTPEQYHVLPEKGTETAFTVPSGDYKEIRKKMFAGKTVKSLAKEAKKFNR